MFWIIAKFFIMMNIFILLIKSKKIHKRYKLQIMIFHLLRVYSMQIYSMTMFLCKKINVTEKLLSM